jgi:threonyl-tRNA synthetase
MSFFLPHGQRIYQAMIDLLRKEYRKRGFSEVQTPNMLSTDLWKISGHYDHYKDNMFLLKVDDQEHGLKPMNCPA